MTLQKRIEKIKEKLAKDEKLISFYYKSFFFIVIILIVIAVELFFINRNLNIIVDSKIFGFEYETRNEVSVDDPIIMSETQNAPQENYSDEDVTENYDGELRTAVIQNAAKDYIINNKSKTIHITSCSFTDKILEENKLLITATDEEIEKYLQKGYKMCSVCGGNL